MPLPSRLWLSLGVSLGLLAALGAGPPAASCAVSERPAPAAHALAAGLRAFRHHRARSRARLRRSDVWTLIDYDRPFTAVRLWVMRHGGERDGAVLTYSRVSHALGSGLLHASDFSNRPGSQLSSLGSYATARHSYEGRFGHSLRVHGLDAGVNDNALKRAIVFHPDSGFSHSLGCFMLPETSSAPIIDTIAGGSFVYVHSSR